MTDPHARLEAAFRRHYRDIAAYCRRRCPTPEDAEEAATEVFAVAWRRIGELPDGDEERLWLYGAARRVVANQQRSRRRRERLAARLASEPPPAPLPSPDGAVLRALHALPERDRELLLLSAWEGLSPAEIATVLGCPAAVVSTRLWRARRRFAHVYETTAPRAVPEGVLP